MGVICIAQERQPDHCDKLIVYDGARYHSISPSQQPGFPIIHILLYTDQLFLYGHTKPVTIRIKSKSHEPHMLQDNT